MSWIVKTIADIIRNLLKRGETQQHEEPKPARRVKLTVDFVPKEGGGDSFHPNLYRIRAAYNKELGRFEIEDEYVDVDVAFVKLLKGGLTAVNWKGSALCPVEVKIPYTLQVAGLGKTWTLRGEVDNASTLFVRLPVKGLPLINGLVDAGYFYVSEPLHIKATFHPITTKALATNGDIVEADAYTEEQTFETSARLHCVAQIPRKIETEPINIVEPDGEIVGGGGADRLIRTSPSIEQLLSEIETTYANLKPNTDFPSIGGREHITIQVDDKLMATGVIVAVKVNNEPAALFSTETPYRAVYLPIEVGKKYDIDVLIAVEPAVYPFAVYNPRLLVKQIKLTRHGWEPERLHGGVVGNDIRITPLPIGLTSYRIVADKPNRGYSVLISADVVGRETWSLYARWGYDDERRQLIIRDAVIYAKAEGMDKEFPLTGIIADDVHAELLIYGKDDEGDVNRLWKAVDFIIPLYRDFTVDVPFKPSAVDVTVKGVFHGHVNKRLWSLPIVAHKEIEYDENIVSQGET